MLGAAKAENINVAVTAKFAAWAKGGFLQLSNRKLAVRLRRCSIMHLLKLSHSLQNVAANATKQRVAT
ncbi:hypothetical protein EAS62_37150 [Bradyrhizobium zhanjiangense]|uniref:Transposase DDE domain-containing protein n=1 Tax=Bradyrhizobium zhanjiangense TaxID=1325107 RepID=A0ABY0D9D2_9BRAD|nr:hypothetical protein EAS62_37150 [Bradyrhizobium zhanjiangense]